MPKRALITGITGQDGSYLAELLLSRGYDRVTSAIAPIADGVRDPLKSTAGATEIANASRHLPRHKNIEGAIPKVENANSADNRPKKSLSMGDWPDSLLRLLHQGDEGRF
jgi:hypothetical protein